MDPHHGDISIDHHHHHNNPTVFLVVDESKSAQYWANLNYPRLPVKYFSVFQILLGCIAVVCQVIIILIYCQRDSIYQEYTTGEGIYSGLFYILAGTLGCNSIRKTTTFRISVFLLFSLFSFILAASHLLFSLTHMITNVRDYKMFANVEFSMYMTMIYASALESFVAITSAIICCRVVCCLETDTESSVVLFPEEEEGKYQVMPLPKSFAEHIERKHRRLSEESEEAMKLTSVLVKTDLVADSISDALSCGSDEYCDSYDGSDKF